MLILNTIYYMPAEKTISLQTAFAGLKILTIIQGQSK